jgi:hypothetical protein
VVLGLTYLHSIDEQPPCNRCSLTLSSVHTCKVRWLLLLCMIYHAIGTSVTKPIFIICFSLWFAEIANGLRQCCHQANSTQHFHVSWLQTRMNSKFSAGTHLCVTALVSSDTTPLYSCPKLSGDETNDTTAECPVMLRSIGCLGLAFVDDNVDLDIRHNTQQLVVCSFQPDS